MVGDLFVVYEYVEEIVPGSGSGSGYPVACGVLEAGPILPQGTTPELPEGFTSNMKPSGAVDLIANIAFMLTAAATAVMV